MQLPPAALLLGWMDTPPSADWLLLMLLGLIHFQQHFSEITYCTLK